MLVMLSVYTRVCVHVIIDAAFCAKPAFLREACLYVPFTQVQHVIVRKDNKGLLGAEWHLQSVEVWHPALKKRFFFVCNDWLKVRSMLSIPDKPFESRENALC